MSEKIRIVNSDKSNDADQGKRGFTLVELCVVMALIAILATMTVTFCVLMNRYTSDIRTEYEFLEDCSLLKNSLTEWARENDLIGNDFQVSNRDLFVASAKVRFSDGVLSLGEKQRAGLDTVDGIYFKSNGDLVKCVMYRVAESGKTVESSFVFSLRCATLNAEVSGGD